MQVEPEEIKPSIGKKLLNILLVVFVLLLILAITAFVLTKIKDSKIANIVEKQEITAPPRELTEAEKLQILADLASSTPKDTPAQTAEKLRILQELAKKTPNESASSTAEKLRILQSLSNQ